MENMLRNKVRGLYRKITKKTQTETQERRKAPKNKTWAFNSGNIFAGNPKWLFIYINNYRKDIRAYWLCDSDETVEYIRSLGYEAYNYASEKAKRLEMKTGVYVVEQVKESIPVMMPNVKMLNLFHGVGCKSIERKVDTGFLCERIAKKYIKYNEFYKKNQLFLVTSPLMEKHFMEQCGIDEDKVIRAGYPRCIYQNYYEKVATFDHDIKRQKGLGEDAKIAVYAPTYRDNAQSNFMSKAFPDMEALHECLKRNNMIMIFKIHPLVANDFEYLQIKEKYEDDPYFLFWDNANDIYEIFDQVDLGIIDYSSIFYDMMAGGTKHFIRYFFDYGQEDTIRDMVFDLEEMTCGQMCRDFEQLLHGIDHYEEDDLADKERISKLFWEYSDEESMERIINQTLEFNVDKDKEMKDLYTFDLFDTVFSRKVLDPIGIFYYVKEKMEKSQLEFPKFLLENYPKKRQEAEANVREWYIKTLALRDSERREITFREIFDRMAEIHELNEEQIQALMNWEVEAELENVIPISDRIAYIEELLENGEDVIFISDMYLPLDVIKQMLEKAAPSLTEVPLFLSSEYGVQKTTKKLFLEVYKSFGEYPYKQWIHHGDSELADGARPKSLAIKTNVHAIPKFNEYEEEFVEKIGTYDSYLLAAKMARFRFENSSIKDYYSYAYVSTYFVPYISWVLKDALRKGIECLYFISRDGYHLKRIADKMIEMKGLSIKTKYIYGSRRAWRVPSFVEEIEDEFFSAFGNMTEVKNFNNLLKSLHITEEDFEQIFPDMLYLRDLEEIDDQNMRSFRQTCANSAKYREKLLERAAEERQIVLDYHRQEIDFNEKYAFVEYWGRGYTQECHKRIMQCAAEDKVDVPYYYARSIYGTEGESIRYNYTTDHTSLIFVEALFANIPYKSIEYYQYMEDGSVQPVIENIECDKKLFRAMERCLVRFVEDFCNLELNDPEYLEQQLFEFGMNYYKENQDDPVFAECLAPLIDSVGTYGEKREFAPALTEEILDRIMRGESVGRQTKSVDMTLKRSSEKNIHKYNYLTEAVPQMLADCRREVARQTKNMELNVQYGVDLERFNRDKATYQKMYDDIVKQKQVVLGKCVLFIGKNVNVQMEYVGIRKQIEKHDGMFAVEITRKKKYTEEELEEIATAQFIFVSTQFDFVSMMTFRPQTKVVMTWMNAFSYNSFGLQLDVNDEIPNERPLQEAKFKNQQLLIPVGSEELVDSFKQAFDADDSQVLPIGSCITDALFDEEAKKEAYEHLWELFPQAKGKKIIYYAPQNRKRGSGCRVAEYLNVSMMREKLGDEYVLLVYYRVSTVDRKYYVSKENQDFVMNMTGLMALREMLLVTDIFVGDYKNVLFEATLLNKPIFLTADDCAVYAETKQMQYEYEEITVGTTISDSNDLIRKIDHIDTYNYEPMNQFREKYLNKCDGKTAERLFEYLLDEK